MSISANDILDACPECAEPIEMAPFDYSHRYHLLATLGGRYFAGSYDDARIASAVSQAVSALGAEVSIGDLEGAGAAQPQPFERTATSDAQRTGDEVV